MKLRSSRKYLREFNMQKATNSIYAARSSNQVEQILEDLKSTI